LISTDVSLFFRIRHFSNFPLSLLGHLFLLSVDWVKKIG